MQLGCWIGCQHVMANFEEITIYVNCETCEILKRTKPLRFYRRRLPHFITMYIDFTMKVYSEYVNCRIGEVRWITKHLKKFTTEHIILSSSNGIAILRHRQPSKTTSEYSSKQRSNNNRLNTLPKIHHLELFYNKK